MTKFLNSFPFYPLLLAIYPVLRLYGDNSDRVGVVNILQPLLFSLLLALALWLAMRCLYKDVHRASVSAALCLILFFSYGVLFRWLTLACLDHGVNPDIYIRHRYFLTAWFAILVVGMSFVRKMRAPDPKFLNLALSLLVMMTIGSAASKSVGSRQDATNLAPVPSVGSSIAVKERPDIYYIILDGYGRADLLQHFYGFDNSDFVNSLRSRGFWVGDKSRSNYLETGYSLPSSLNFDTFSRLSAEASSREEKWLSDSRVFFHLVDYNRAAGFLRTQGYRIVNMGSGFSLTNYSRGADINYGSTLSLAEFNSTFYTSTIFVAFMSPSIEMITGPQLLANMSHIQEVAHLPGPKFVFAHILSPHPPYQFNANGGKPPEPPSGVLLNWGNHDAYVGQIKYLNGLVLRTVDRIVAESPHLPIIVIQGDHGPSLVDHTLAVPWNKTWTPDLLNMRSGILNALLVPNETKRKLYPKISPVNTFRTIFRSLFGASLRNLPDHPYYSTLDRPHVFIRIPPDNLVDYPSNAATVSATESSFEEPRTPR
jgi:hypothetical protein